METRIKSAIKLTSDTTDYLDGRLRSIEKLLGDAADKARCEVEISRAAGKKQTSDHMWVAEILVKVPGRTPVIARNHAATVNASIDDVKEEIERQLRKLKTMNEARKKKGGTKLKKIVRGE